MWDETVGFRSPQAGEKIPSIVMETGNAHLLFSWDGKETGSWGMLHSCGGMGVDRDANGMGRD